MATVLTQTLPASDVQIRIMEPFTSKALNRKAVGIIPAGIYRGYTPQVVGLDLKLLADSTTGDSVAVVDTLNEVGVANNFNVTVYHEGDLTLDFTPVANGTYYVVLEVRYAITSTVPFQGVTDARVKVINLGDLVPQHVILTKVTKSGVLLTLDTSVRQDTGGPLVVPNRLPIANIDTVTTSPSQVIGGSLVDIVGAVLNFSTAEAGDVLVMMNVHFQPPADGGMRFLVDLDGTASFSIGRAFANTTTSGGSSTTTIRMAFSLHEVFTGVPAGLHTLKGRGLSEGGSGTLFECRLTALHR
jgi:hypothetical protein